MSKAGIAAQPTSATIESAVDTLAVELAGLQSLQAAILGELGPALEKVVELVIASKGRLIVSGMGKSGHVGRKIAATLTSTGTPSFFLHPAEASHGDLGMVTQDDVVLAISWSGESRELGDVVSYAKRYRVPLIAVTSRADSTLGKAADVPLILPQATEACPHGLAPTTSTLLQLALGDVIAVALLRQRDFTPANFHRFHPGGKLGSSLKSVGDLMRRPGHIAAVTPDQDMRTVILAMTSHSVGSAIVVDGHEAVLGIITDGDLRRHMGGDLMAKTAGEIMTPGPVTCPPDMLGSAALALMSRHKVNALAVVENRRLCGMLTMHTLLAAGIS
jgi:arabinose-5-phosphate isomerase